MKTPFQRLAFRHGYEGMPNDILIETDDEYVYWYNEGRKKADEDSEWMTAMMEKSLWDDHESL